MNSIRPWRLQNMEPESELFLKVFSIRDSDSVFNSRPFKALQNIE